MVGETVRGELPCTGFSFDVLMLQQEQPQNLFNQLLDSAHASPLLHLFRLGVEEGSRK